MSPPLSGCLGHSATTLRAETNDCVHGGSGRLEPKLTRNRSQPLIQRPKRQLHDASGRQQMHVYPTQSSAEELVRFDEFQRLIMLSNGHRRQRRKQCEYSLTLRQASAGELSDHERMDPDLACVELLRKLGIPRAEMIYPNGRVDEQERLKKPGRFGAARWASNPVHCPRARPTGGRLPAG